jgi:Ca2+-binding RTX toxin-like protein
LAGPGNDGVTVDPGEGTDTIFAGTGFDTVTVEDAQAVVFGEDDNDLLLATGTSASVTFDGGEGNDQLLLAQGAEGTLIGGLGNDVLQAAGSYGAISGGAGNDDIYLGRSDADADNGPVTGGEGEDDFFVEARRSGEAPVIADFDTDDDLLALDVPAGVEVTDLTISVIAGEEGAPDVTQVMARLNGSMEVLAVLAGDVGLTAEDVVILQPEPATEAAA